MDDFGYFEISSSRFVACKFHKIGHGMAVVHRLLLERPQDLQDEVMQTLLSGIGLQRSGLVT